MRELSVASGRGGYRVVVGEGLLEDAAILEPELRDRTALVVSNVTVGPLHARRLAARLGLGEVLELPDGERFKVWRQVESICRRALEKGVDRAGVLVAVGGGVVTDMVGFAASVYLRGVSWIAVPTSLLAMVDAAIGGKTGIDLAEGKNLVGTFWPPRLVLSDVAALETLAERELRAGLAEVVKAGWIADRGLLEMVPEVGSAGSGFRGSWEELVARAAAVKIAVVERDEREAGARQALNLGHTLGHALEAATEFGRFLHGEAVAWGMLAAGRIALARKVLSPAGWEDLERAVARLAPLPPAADLDVERLLPYIGRDKKRTAAGVSWVLPTDEGVVLGQRVTVEEIRAAWEALRKNPPGRRRRDRG